jgi:hypothetical protein
MKQMQGKARLYMSAATMAVIASWAAPAAAQCAADGTTVTCTGTVTSGAVNTATNSVAPPSVTLRITSDATVARTAANVQPSSAFVGAVDVGNAGTLGTPAATVGINYFGTPAATTNTFTLTNSGVVTGGVVASQVGGAIVASNTGTIAGGLQLFGSGPITLTSSGPIYVAGGTAGSTGVQLQSFRGVTTTTGTVGTDGATSTVQTAGAVAATITAPVAIPAPTGGAATPQAVSVGSFGAGGSARLTLDALAGNVNVSAGGANSTSTPGGGNTSTVDGVTTTRSANSSTAVGGAAAATLGTNARVANLTVQSGPGGATTTVAGVVGTAAAPGSMFVNSVASNSASSNEFASSATGSTSRNANSTTAVSGAARAEIAATGTVIGNVSVQSGSGNGSALIAGTIGSAATPGAVSITASQTNGANTSETVSSATGSTTRSTSISTPVGGTATAEIASTGSVFGNVNATSNAGAAAATVAGTVGAGSGTGVTTPGSVSATSVGTGFNQVNVNSSSPNGDFSNATTFTQAATGSTAATTVAASGNVFGSVSANGDRGATVDNAGRIRDNAQATSNRSITTASDSLNSRATTAGAGGASTVVERQVNSSTFQANGGAAALTNRAGGVIEDNVSVAGLGSASLTNAGAIFGNVNLTSTGNRSENASSTVMTTTTTPATGGGATVRREQVSSSTTVNTPIGGTATGTYGGTIGAASGSALAAATTINQSGQAGSTAAVGGTLYADLTTAAGATRTENSSGSTSLSVIQPATGAATPAGEFTNSNTSRNTGTVVAANNAVAVTGALRNNGNGTGDLQATSTGGAATVTIDGGIVEGGVSVFANNGLNTSNGNDFASRSTQAATAAGPAAPVIQQSSSSSSFNEQRRATGTASLSLTGAARVGGNVVVNGTGTGASSTGASATIASTATLGGTLTVTAAGSGGDFRSDNSSTSTRTGATAVTRTDRSSSATTRPANAGNASATIAGTVGGNVAVSAPWGNAAATLSGQVANGGGINVNSFSRTSTNSSESTFRGTSATTLDAFIPTGFTQSNTATLAGGTATLTIASAGTTATSGLSAVEGGINVGGDGGSTLTIATGTRVLAGNGAGINVGSGRSSTTQSQTNTYNTAGAQTGQTSTFTSTVGGGEASITNAGIVGSSTGFTGAPISVNAFSVGGASITNSGTVYGALTADSLYTNYSQTSTTTGQLDPVTQQTVTTGATTLVGGAAAITNSGVVSGSATLLGATGTLANTGVLRGGAALGDGIFAGTETTTSNATTNTFVQTAPATRFVQTYTVNQNGLLLNGITVRSGNVTDFSTGATANATLRTSDVRATINLNGGSATTGNIVAAVDASNTRLTDTTVNLVGAGFLGVGTGLTPPAALGVGAGTLRYENVPNYAGFAAIDPALGSSASGAFVPSQAIASGSRITGVNLVDRSGTGVFTFVGSPFLAASNANPQAVYTVDTGTFRVTSGELQLGVSGADPATGTSIFGIRGNVLQNGGTLLLGRRVTDGTTSVVQGVNLRVDGNFTQAAGTLAVAATPALVRIAGTQVGALPASGVLGFGGYGVALTPFVPFDPTTSNQLRSTPSSVTVNGNLSLAGTVSIAAQPGAIYAAGRGADLFNVSGTYTATGLAVTSPMTSPFVRFALTSRTEGGRTIVSVDVARTAYASVAATTNAAAAAGALDAAVPNVIARLRGIPSPNSVTDVQGYGYLQDLATVISALDTQVSAAQATEAFNELASGSVYGSLSAITTTAAFGDAAEAPTGDVGGVGLWLRPTGQFARYNGDADTGAGRLRADNYGGSMGIGISTGEGGTFGIGGGYGRIDARDKNFPSTASADTYMLGIYGRQRYRNWDISAQGVYGWSNWDTTRTLPLFSRIATASFDSKEFRLTVRLGYDILLNGLTVTPFGRVDLRRYDFESFTEQDAGGIGLAVAGREKKVFSPEAGLRIAGDMAGIQPFAEASYVFQGDVGGARTVAYLGDRATNFRLRGVDPRDFARIGAGISGTAYGATFHLRGNYLTGGGNRVGEVLGGISLRF